MPVSLPQPPAWARQTFFIPPHFQCKRPIGRLRLVRNGRNSTPSALFIEARSSIVANRACEPRCFHAAFRQPVFCIGDQHAGDFRSACRRRHVELIEFVAFQDGESDWSAGRACDSDIRKGLSQPVSKALERAVSLQFSGQNLGMGVLPAVVPNPCENINFTFPQPVRTSILLVRQLRDPLRNDRSKCGPSQV